MDSANSPSSPTDLGRGQSPQTEPQLNGNGGGAIASSSSTSGADLKPSQTSSILKERRFKLSRCASPFFAPTTQDGSTDETRGTAGRATGVGEHTQPVRLLQVLIVLGAHSRRRIKCDEGHPCQSCLTSNSACTFEEPGKRTHPHKSKYVTFTPRLLCGLPPAPLSLCVVGLRCPPCSDELFFPVTPALWKRQGDRRVTI